MKNIFFILVILMGVFVNAQEDKTITLTVTGSGKTIEEAKTNALRSAIEQAFGAFISSKTEVLNDALIKDEVVSVSNGNIQKFDVVSQVEIPNNGYAVTLNATVSVSKLTSFAKSKGVTIEINGGTFAANIIQQELNENAEFKSLENILKTSTEILKKSFDYSIETNGDMTKMENGQYSIPLKVKVKLNKNFYQFRKYLMNSLSGLTMSETEIENYEQLKKQVSQIIVRRDTLNYMEDLFVEKKNWDGISTFRIDIDNFKENTEKAFILGGTESNPMAFEINKKDELKVISKNFNLRNLGNGKWLPAEYLYKVKKNDLGYFKIYLRNPISIGLIDDFLTNLKYMITSFEISDNTNSFSGDKIIKRAKISNNLAFVLTRSPFAQYDGWDGNYNKYPIIPNCFAELKDNSISNYFTQDMPLKLSFFKAADNYKNYFPNLLSILPLKKTDKTILLSMSKYKENDLITTFEFNDTKSLEELKQLSEYKINPKN